MTQWEPRASPPGNLLGITLSDDAENAETVSEADANAATSARPLIGGDGEANISYSFSPHTLTRRNSLFYGIPSSSLGEE